MSLFSVAHVFKPWMVENNVYMCVFYSHSNVFQVMFIIYANIV